MKLLSLWRCRLLHGLLVMTERAFMAAGAHHVTRYSR